MNKIPQRIISLVPSQTELLYDLGLDEKIIGITKFCVHPEKWFRTKTRIGGTKDINIEKIISLNPDLVIANKEENVKEQIEALQAVTNVYVSDVSNLADALNMISEVGELIDKKTRSKEITDEIKKRFSGLKQEQFKNVNAAYLIWKNPFMTIGGDTFIHDMMLLCGLKNVFADEMRYPETSIEQLQSLNCEALLLASEPFPFKQKHVDALQPHLPNTKILLVDGEMFSWYGSRLLYAPDYFKQVIKIIDAKS